LVRNYSIASMLDAPCGDFVWMRRVEFPEKFRYVGADIVAELVSELQAKHQSPTRQFIKLDVRTDRLPDVDLWLCRDCLIHLSNDDALSALRNFARSNIKYLLTTTYNFGYVNADIETGNFRALNLRKPPFLLPRPLALLKDYKYPATPRRLALWSRDQLVSWETAHRTP